MNTMVNGKAAALARQAAEASAQGRHGDAIGLLQNALAASPDNAVLHYNLGLEYAAAGDASKAREAFRNAAREDAASASALTELGRMEIDAGRLSAAVEALDAALEREPDSPKALNNRGVAAFLQGKHAESAVFFRRAAEADPKLADAWFNLADACAEIGDAREEVLARSRYEKLQGESDA